MLRLAHPTLNSFHITIKYNSLSIESQESRGSPTNVDVVLLQKQLFIATHTGQTAGRLLLENIRLKLIFLPQEISNCWQVPRFLFSQFCKVARCLPILKYETNVSDKTTRTSYCNRSLSSS